MKLKYQFLYPNKGYICSLDALKESSKKKETKIKKKIVEVLQQASTVKRGQGIKRSEC